MAVGSIYPVALERGG